MDITVVKDDEQAPDATPEVEEPTAIREPRKSARINLRAIRESIVEKLYIDLKVPRWSVEDESGTFDVYVRYAPVRSAKVDQSMKRRSEQTHNENEASLLVHVDILIDSCRGVYYVLDGDMDSKYAFQRYEDDEEVQPTDYWHRFDTELGFTLGLNEFQSKLAENVCRALYATDGDLVDASVRVSAWSAKSNEEAEKDFTNP